MKKLLVLLALSLGVWLAGANALAQAPQVLAAPGPADSGAAVVAEMSSAAAAVTVYRGDVAWVVVSTLLVNLIAAPGLALFYGGLVRSPHMRSVLMQVLAVFALISGLWVVYGYSLAFGGHGLVIANLDKVFLQGVSLHSWADTLNPAVKLPEYVFVAFQATFAGITCALIVGAVAERIKFSAMLLFSMLWFTFAYLPVVHMVWGSGGYLLGKGALDFAGGAVVHINAAVAALVGAYSLGPRLGYGRVPMTPHNLTWTVVGTAMLWVGWFGFNAGSNLEASGAALAFINTGVATVAGILAWCLGEFFSKGRASVLGAALGAVSGLVAVTPACGYVGFGGAAVIGALAGLTCLWGVTLLRRLRNLDDLDVFGVHGIGGVLGALLTAVFASPALGGTASQPCG